MARKRSPATALARLLAESSQPLMVLDADRRVLSVNAACESWLELSAEQLIGGICNYHAPPTGDRLDGCLAALCPPPDLLPARGARRLRLQPPGSEARWAECFAIATAADTSPSGARPAGEPALEEPDPAADAELREEEAGEAQEPAGPSGETQESFPDEPGEGSFSLEEAKWGPVQKDPVVPAVGGYLWLVDTRRAEPVEAQGDSIDWDAERLHAKLQELRAAQSLVAPYMLLGESPLARRLRDQVRLVRGQSTHVVIVGPAGSGREQLARYIHYGPEAGERSGDDRSLMPVACALMDAELLQSTIRAFVRHVRQKPGRHAALLMLDVDLLTPAAQAELAGFLALPDFDLPTIATARRMLRVEPGQFERESLPPAAAAGSNSMETEPVPFRDDLAQALCTLVIQLPPLADRRDDIPLIAQHLLEQYNAEGGKQLSGFREGAMDLLVAYDWPENLAELVEVVAASVQRAAGPWIEPDDLPELLHLAAGAAARPRRVWEPIDLDQFLTRIESELLRRALEVAGGNKTRAAEMLGISRARLHRRVEQLHLEPEPGSEAVVNPQVDT